jgi:ubiquinone/menaquinone biosynthesis C-methylase UbiE
MGNGIGRMTDARTWSARYIDRLYEAVARVYPAYVTIGSLGAFPAVYGRAAAALQLRPGETVFDLCCGTGLMIPHLAAAVGPQGRIVAVDRSSAMMRQARLLALRHRIGTVEFIQCDLGQFRADRTVDAAIACIALSCIPDCEEILRNFIRSVRPGGRIVVVDSFLNRGRWYFPLTNLINQAKGIVIQACPSNGMRAVMRHELVDYHEEIVHLGIYSIISGTRPDEAALGPGGSFARR